MNIPCGRKPVALQDNKDIKIPKEKGRKRKEEGKVRCVVGGQRADTEKRSGECGLLGMCLVQPVLLVLCPEFQKGAHCQAGPGREGEAGCCSAGPGI